MVADLLLLFAQQMGSDAVPPDRSCPDRLPGRRETRKDRRMRAVVVRQHGGPDVLPR
jgi:hypothetical protein